MPYVFTSRSPINQRGFTAPPHVRHEDGINWDLDVAEGLQIYLANNSGYEVLSANRDERHPYVWKDFVNGDVTWTMSNTSGLDVAEYAPAIDAYGAECFGTTNGANRLYADLSSTPAYTNILNCSEMTVMVLHHHRTDRDNYTRILQWMGIDHMALNGANGHDWRSVIAGANGGRITPDTDAFGVWCIRGKSGDRRQSFNGTYQTSTNTNVTWSITDDSTMDLFNASGNNRRWSGWLFNVAIWDRFLSDDEVASFGDTSASVTWDETSLEISNGQSVSGDAWQLIRPRKHLLYFDMATGGTTNIAADTDTLTLTENPATLGYDVQTSLSTKTVATNAATLTYDIQGAVTTKTVTNNAAVIGYDIQTALATKTVTTYQASLDAGNVSADTATLTLTTNAVTVGYDLQSNTTAKTVATNAATLTYDIQGAVTTKTVTGNSSVIGYDIQAGTAAKTVATYQATVDQNVAGNISATVVSLTLATKAATITTLGGGGGGPSTSRFNRRLLRQIQLDDEEVLALLSMIMRRK